MINPIKKFAGRAFAQELMKNMDENFGKDGEKSKNKLRRFRNLRRKAIRLCNLRKKVIDIADRNEER